MLLSSIGIVCAIIVVILLSWNRWNAIVCAVVGALIVGIFSGLGVTATFTDYFLPSAGATVTSYLLMFLTSAMYAKIIGDSGAAVRIGDWVLSKFGEKYIFVTLMTLVMALCYGGVNALVVIFVFWPIAVPIARKLNKPRYLFVNCMYCGFLTGACTCLPGSPQNANILAASTMGTSSTAAPLLGIALAAILFVFDCWWMSFMDKRATKRGDTFEEGVGIDLPARDIANCPGIAKSLIPILALLVISMGWSNGWFGIPKISAVIAITVGNVVASFLCIALNFKFFAFADKSGKAATAAKKGIMDGLVSGLSPFMNFFAMIAFTSVIAATPAFEGFTGWLASTSFSPYFQAVIAANLIGIVNGSAGATAQFVGQTFGQGWLAAGVNADAMTRLISLSSVGLSNVPYSGGLFSTLDVTGVKIKDGWWPQFVGSAVPMMILAFATAALLTAIY